MHQITYHPSTAYIMKMFTFILFDPVHKLIIISVSILAFINSEV